MTTLTRSCRWPRTSFASSTRGRAYSCSPTSTARLLRTSRRRGSCPGASTASTRSRRSTPSRSSSPTSSARASEVAMTVAGATRPPSMDRPAASATVSFTMHGIGVSGGIAIGHAHLFAGMSAEVDHYDISGLDVVREQRRYDRAVKEVKEELAELAESVRPSTASELAPFVNVHLMLLEDAASTDT